MLQQIPIIRRFASLVVGWSILAALFLMSGGLWAVAGSNTVYAQTPDVMPTVPPPIIPRVFPVAPGAVVELHKVEATVQGPVATVNVTQVFRNDGGRPAEGVYLFPLPKDAAVSDFQMTVDGQTLEGRLLSREEARRIYEEIVRSQRDPALLEYLDRGLFQASVFPIPAGETRTLEFNYTQVLEKSDDLYRLNYPLPTSRYSQAPVEEVVMTIALTDLPGLRTIYSPNYPIRIERSGDDGATVTFEATDTQPQTDFDLYFGTDAGAIGLNLLSYKPAGEDGYFVLLAAPGVDVNTEEVVARDLVLVLDVSGSMQGDKIKQAQAAATYVVENLNPGDRINLIAFSTGTRLWQRSLQPVTKSNQQKALRWIDGLDASGSTDINRSLLEALAQVTPKDQEESARPAYILFLTDGQPTQGETVPDRIIANADNNRPADRSIRLFAFGVGYDVNTDLLDIVSQQLGGRDSYVKPGERIDEAVSAFYAQISTPVLANVALDYGAEVTVDELYPFPLPDLFAGEQLVLVGRYADGARTDVELTGDVNGVERLYIYPDQELVDQGGEPFVARLWATRKIGALLEQIRRSGVDDELVDAIVDLSLEYGIVTPYTSYLVEEPAMRLGSGDRGGGEALAAPAGAMADQARIVVEEKARSMAAEAPSGSVAVADSEARDALQTAQTVQQQRAVRYVAGRTFKLQDTITTSDGQILELWVDTRFDDEMQVETIEFGSDEYFDLIDEPAMSEWLSISAELVIVVDEDTALRITTDPQ